jgi:hypothetical protein
MPFFCNPLLGNRPQPSREARAAIRKIAEAASRRDIERRCESQSVVPARAIGSSNYLMRTA